MSHEFRDSSEGDRSLLGLAGHRALNLRAMAVIGRIRQKIIDREYYLSSHAEDEMWADALERTDLETAILKGRVERRMTKDPRGTRYRIEGPARDGRAIHVICRFNETAELVIITVYALREER